MAIGRIEALRDIEVRGRSLVPSWRAQGHLIAVEVERVGDLIAKRIGLGENVAPWLRVTGTVHSLGEAAALVVERGHSRPLRPGCVPIPGAGDVASPPIRQAGAIPRRPPRALPPPPRPPLLR